MDQKEVYHNITTATTYLQHKRHITCFLIMKMQNKKSALFGALISLAFSYRRDNSLALAFSSVSPSSQHSSAIVHEEAARYSPFSLASSSSNNVGQDLIDDDDAARGGGQRSLLSLDTAIPHDKSIMASSRSRRQVVSSLLLWTGVAFVGGGSAIPQPANANAKDKDKGPPISQEEAFARVQRELQGDGGSVALLQTALNAGDYAQLMSLSRDMDLSLRKLVMIKAKGFVKDGDAGIMVCNAVTFDLIGINRNSRPGQENAEQVQKYIDELKDDMQRMLTLERVPIEV
jgi:hypothetical protein